MRQKNSLVLSLYSSKSRSSLSSSVSWFGVTPGWASSPSIAQLVVAVADSECWHHHHHHFSLLVLAVMMWVWCGLSVGTNFFCSLLLLWQILSAGFWLGIWCYPPCYCENAKIAQTGLEELKILNKGPQIGLKEALRSKIWRLQHLEIVEGNEVILEIPLRLRYFKCLATWNRASKMRSFSTSIPQDHSHNSDPAPYPDNLSDVPYALGIVCASPQSHFAVSSAHHGIP
nr:hypothetical protein Iba_chr09eCG4010 [Ipomoea batatas]